MATTVYTAVPAVDPTTHSHKKLSLVHDNEITDHAEKSRPAWRLNLSLAAVATAVVLLINVIVAIYSAVASQGFHNGTSILYKGDCARAAKLSTWSHIGINILSTILLSASNAVQQYLSSPTREEVDQAHAVKDWLDIGIPSMRNLFSSRIAIKRRILWWLLAIGSLPLHWIYNSAIFSSLSGQEYAALVVNEEFIHGTDNAFIDPVRHWVDALYGDSFDFQTTNSSLADLRNIMDTFDRLTPFECINAYANQVVTNRRHVIVVVPAPSYNVSFCNSADPGNTDRTCWQSNPLVTNSLLDVRTSTYRNWRDESNSYGWICGSLCQTRSQIDQAKQAWYADGAHTAEYCLSQRVQEQCTLRISFPIVIVVITFNLIKLACLITALFAIQESPLSTIGDAIASFMQHHDPYTSDMSLVPRADFEQKEKWTPGPRVYYDKPRPRYFSSMNHWKWVICDALYVGAIVATAVFISNMISLMSSENLDGARDTWQAILKDGFGQLIARNLWLLNPGLIPSALLANLPQLILSVIYLTYNTLITSVFLTEEYASYSVANQTKNGKVKARSLRVTSVVKGSAQRRTHYLQLPFRYAIPLMTCSAALHWFVSQSFFLATVDVYKTTSMRTENEMQSLDPDASIGTCGFSSLPLVCAIVLFGLMVVALNIIGFRKVNSGMPVAGSCSAAIAAACHGQGSGLGPVTWGVIEEDEQLDDMASTESPANSHTETPKKPHTDMHTVLSADSSENSYARYTKLRTIFAGESPSLSAQHEEAEALTADLSEESHARYKRLRTTFASAFPSLYAQHTFMGASLADPRHPYKRLGFIDGTAQRPRNAHSYA